MLGLKFDRDGKFVSQDLMPAAKALKNPGLSQRGRISIPHVQILQCLDPTDEISYRARDPDT